MEKFLKYIPLGLLTFFGMKALVSSPSYIDVACLAVLGITAFLYEHNIQKKALIELTNSNQVVTKQLSDMTEEIKHLKAYVTSRRMNEMRTVNGQKSTF